MSASIIGVRVGSMAGDEKLDRWQRTYTLVYMVQTTAAGDGSIAVLDAAGMPRLGWVYGFGNEIDFGARCRSRTPRQTSKFLWEVTIQYDSQHENLDQQNKNPLARPLEVEWGSVPYQEVAAKDRYGRPITNSAGDRYADPVMRDRSDAVLSITRNEPFYDANLADYYADVVNADTFYSAPPGRVRCARPTARAAYEEDLAYWVVTYQFFFKKTGWDEVRLDVGPAYWGEPDSESGERTKYKFTSEDEDGNVAAVEGHLDGAGGKLSDAQIQAGQFAWNTHEIPDRVPFAPLGLW